MTWIPGPSITFWTAAPEDAPEVKGSRCYFKPERLEWRVSMFNGRGAREVLVYMVAHGPATRSSRAYPAPGTQVWDGQSLPPWASLPSPQMEAATAVIGALV